MDKPGMVVAADEPPLAKSTDSDACIDEIECFPKQYDCRNNPAVSESYSKFEQQMTTIYMKELETKTLTAEQHQKLIQQQTQMTQEQYDHKLAITKLMIKQMNHHHHLQEQKYMHEIHSLRELFNLSEQQWKARMNVMDEQLRQQQLNHSDIISDLKDEIKLYNAQNQIYSAESQKAASNFDSARLELNELIESNQTIVQTLETKIDKQSDELFTFRADTTAEKEEMELMVQSWMAQCEVIQQQVQDFQADLTSTKDGLKDTSTMQDEIKASIEKMGQTYENVLEHVMEQIQEQSEVQNTNFNHIQETHSKLQQGLEEVETSTKEKFTQIESSATIQAEKIGSLEEQCEKVNDGVLSLNQSLLVTDGHIAALKDSVNVQTTAQEKLQIDVTGLQSIVAKLADASNNRFVRMETTFESEINSVKDIKKEILDAFETHQERVKTVDSKIVIHSIQLGEISKEVKDINTNISLVKEDHQKVLQSTQNQYNNLSKQMDIQNESQNLVNDNVNKSITSLQNSSKDVKARTSTIEKCIDSMTTRMDEIHDDHSTTRGNFMEQHQSMETTVAKQLQVLTEHVNDIQKTTQNNVRNVADTLVEQVKAHQSKIEEYETILKILNAHSETTINRHEAIEAKVALLQGDVRDTKQNIQKMDQENTLLLNEHKQYANGQLEHITNVIIPHQLESNNLLRARFVAMESAVKDRYEKTNKEMSDRIDQMHENIAGINHTIDELSKTQEGEFEEMKQSIEKIGTDVDAVHESFSLEVAHRSELQTKLLEVESSVELQAAKAIEIESTLETHVTEIRKAQERSNLELNHSLTQVLTLSQMKEAMLNQIADCFARLTILDACKEEHTKQLKEISLEFANHDKKIQAMSEENKSKLSETESTLESYQVALNALKHDVQKQWEVQKGVNDFVSESVAVCSVSISEIDKRTTSINSQLDDNTTNIQNHISSSDMEMTKIMSIFEQLDDNRKNIESKIHESELAMQDSQAKISQDVMKTQLFANDLKATIDRHSDRLKTAKDARAVMRNDLKTMVDSINERFESLRNQMIENKEMNENSNLAQETIVALQDELERWKTNIDQAITNHNIEITNKIEYTTGKLKATSDTTKLNRESIVQIQDEIAMYKADQNHNEKTTELIEEISTKLDYLAGKFKSLNEQTKSTSGTIHSLEVQVSQLTNQQSKQQEQFQIELKEQEQALMSSIASIITDAVNESMEDTHKDRFEKLLADFNDLKIAFDDIKARRQVQNTPNEEIRREERQFFAKKIEDMMKDIDTITQQIRNLELAQCTMKLTPSQVEPSLLPTTDVHGLQDRDETYKSAVMKQRGQLPELISVTPTVKRMAGTYKAKNAYSNYDDNETEEYHEARDAEDMKHIPAQIEHRDQE